MYEEAATLQLGYLRVIQFQNKVLKWDALRDVGTNFILPFIKQCVVLDLKQDASRALSINLHSHTSLTKVTDLALIFKSNIKVIF